MLKSSGFSCTVDFLNALQRFLTYMIKLPELLAPAGDLESLQAALYYGADAIYFASKQFSLRAGADNFDEPTLLDAIALCSKQGKKSYITCNIFGRNSDFAQLKDYLQFLNVAKPNALIASDPGVIEYAKLYAPDIDIHLSTQANTSNAQSALFWARQGIKRLVLSRELSLEEICEIRAALPTEVELETFVHGAMCVAYSGRCLLSSFVSNRSANRGACAQHCRFEYAISEKGRENAQTLTMGEDERGTYILNSKDLNLLMHLDKLTEAGIASFKIEGRAKTAYYVANVVNAYRRALAVYASKKTNTKKEELLKPLYGELYKASHREFFTGFYFDEGANGQCYPFSRPQANYQFIAVVQGDKEGWVQVQQRNKFEVGDTLEVLSPSTKFNQTFTVTQIVDEWGKEVQVANKVKQKLFLKIPFILKKGDILRKDLTEAVKLGKVF